VRRIGGAASAALLVLGAGISRAEPIRGFTPAARGSGFEESFTRALEAGGATTASDAYDFIEATRIAAAAAEAPPEEQVRKPHTFWIGVVSLATIVGSAYNSFGDGPNQRWHFTNEGWIGQNTYAGGGDKASHFVSYYIVAKLLSGVNAELGMRPDPAALLGAGVSAVAGLMTVIGDGRGKYGFSYEDFVMDSLGAAASLAISHYGLDDLIGFRAGLVPAPTAVCCPYGGTGKDYTQEIYTADLKLAGLGERAKFNAGPARFLLVSVSYSAKGYPYADPVVRERQVGFEVGVNFVEILKAVGVPRDKWWGKILYFGFDVLRIPYTQVGMYYDLNSGNWRGPGIGDTWPGGGQ
jgi:hypothetical protein